MKTIIFITGNEGEVSSMRKRLEPLGFDVENYKIDLLEPQFNTIKEISEYKARLAFEEFKKPLVVLDSGLIIPKLNGFPGPFTKYSNLTIKAEGVLALVNAINPEDRSAYFTNHLCFIKNENEIYHFEDKYNVTFADRVIEKENSRAWSELWKITVPVGAKENEVIAISNDYDSYDETARPEGSVWEKFSEFLIEGV